MSEKIKISLASLACSWHWMKTLEMLKKVENLKALLWPDFSLRIEDRQAKIRGHGSDNGRVNF